MPKFVEVLKRGLELRLHQEGPEVEEDEEQRKRQSTLQLLEKLNNYVTNA